MINKIIATEINKQIILLSR